tara:strand:+ start:4795 stop:5448 length:654 start_codon:yes stop_codon:yes gene_type:complete
MKIKELILFTNNLEKQLEFYTKVLELELVKITSESFSLKTGKSLLTFKFSKNCKLYHFAFNIPSNKENEALNWLKLRVDILPFEEREIINFKNWNAKALYFYDTDNNILEFISRKNLKINSNETFSTKAIINISEIGIGTSDIERIYDSINNIKSIEIYDGSFQRFCAIGNEEGLFILVNNNIKKWFPTDDKIYLSDFIIKGDYNFEYKKGKIIEIA